MSNDGGFRIRGLEVQPSICFHSPDNEELGRLSLDNGLLEFTGNADESAKILFKHVTQAFNGQIGELNAEIERLRAVVEDQGIQLVRNGLQGNETD